MRLRLGVLLVCTLLSLPAAGLAAAAEPQPTNKGLYLTPSRAYLSVAPGGNARQSITLANNTDQPMAIALSVEQFAVADYTYDYRFETPREDWITPTPAQVSIQPGKSQSVGCQLAPPKNATPGGHYFAVFATATIENGTTKNQVRAASVLYVTVQGNVVQSSTIKNAQLPWLVFGEIPFAIDIANTGNAHFFAYVSGNVSGLGALGKGAETTHLLLPQTIRHVAGTIPSPLLPGVYLVTYGYTTDTGDTAQRSQHILFVPPWFFCAAIGGLLFLALLIKRRLTGSWRPRYTSWR